jgi:hypothetical protein
MRFLVAFLAAMVALSAGPRAQVGVNYTNGNRNSPTVQAADLLAMQSGHVTLIRVPLEKWNGSYDGSVNLAQAALARGIRTHFVVSLGNPDFFPPGTTRRPGDPVMTSIFTAYRLSDLDPYRVADTLAQVLAGVPFVSLELFNELGNPAFNGDLAPTPAPSMLLGYPDLLTPDLAQFTAGIQRYALALALVRNGLDPSVPLVSAGLNNPGDVPAGSQLTIAWQEVEADGLLYLMRVLGIDASVDQFGMHSYAWGNAAKIHQLNSTLMMRQCSPAKPCAITEWGFSNGSTQLQAITDWRADIATYGPAVASIMYFDWKGATYGITNGGKRTPAGVVALTP